jgi:anion-transporting  ArsA/GET3 family ATPase
MDGVRLHVVTGKGGVGKTTVASALALALSRQGKRVLLAEVEGRQGISQTFDVPPLGIEEVRLVTHAGGGEVWGISVDAKAALLEYLQIFYKLGRAGGALERMGVIDFATTVAPGVRDVLLTGKVYEAVGRTTGTRRHQGPRTWDAVVLDAPPTGRITRFLNVNTDVAGIARVGPVRNQAETIMGLLRSPQTAVHLVTLLEEMPTQETVDAVAELTAAGLPVGAVVVNMVNRPPLGPNDLKAAGRGAVDRGAVVAGLAAGGLAADDAVVTALLEEAGELAQRVALERRERRSIAALGRPTYELDWVPTGVDVAALYEMADDLRQRGVG